MAVVIAVFLVVWSLPIVFFAVVVWRAVRDDRRASRRGGYIIGGPR